MFFRDLKIIVIQQLMQGSGTYDSEARCGSFDDGI